MSPRSPIIPITLALAGLLLVGPASAQTMSDADKAAAKEHFDKGRTAFEQQKFDEAIKELKSAYMLSRKAAILFNIGQTYKQLGDAGLSLHFFQKYLAESEPEDTNRSGAQAAIEELQAAAKAKGESVGPPGDDKPAEGTPAGDGAEGGDKPAEKKDEPTIPEFRHVPIGEAPPTHPVDVRIRLSDDGAEARGFLYYRGQGQERYTKVKFEETAKGLAARIPRKIMASGKSVQYYVEVRGPANEAWGSSGSDGNPNVIVVDPKAKPKMIVESPEPDETTAPARHWPLGRHYRMAKFVGAGLTAAVAGVSLTFAALAARQQTEVEKLARESSTRNDDGSWSTPTVPYDLWLDDMDLAGRRYNNLAIGFGIAAAGVAAVTGALFFMDWQRGHDEDSQSTEVALIPGLGPGGPGATAIIRF